MSAGAPRASGVEGTCLGLWPAGALPGNPPRTGLCSMPSGLAARRWRLGNQGQVAPHQFCLRGGPQDPQLRKYGLAAEQNQGGGRRGDFVHVSEPVARSEVQCLVPGKRGRNRPCEHFLRKGSSGPFLSLCTSAFRASRCFLISQGWISTFIFGIGKICPTGRTVENGTGRLSKRRTLAGGEEAG